MKVVIEIDLNQPILQAENGHSRLWDALNELGEELQIYIDDPNLDVSKYPKKEVNVSGWDVGTIRFIS